MKTEGPQWDTLRIPWLLWPAAGPRSIGLPVSPDLCLMQVSSRGRPGYENGSATVGRPPNTVTVNCHFITEMHRRAEAGVGNGGWLEWSTWARRDLLQVPPRSALPSRDTFVESSQYYPLHPSSVIVITYILQMLFKQFFKIILKKFTLKIVIRVPRRNEVIEWTYCI